MATTVGAIASSHTPTIGFARDTHKQSDPNWAPIFEGYEPVRQWLAEKKSDVLYFQKTRNAQVLYSVAGGDEGKTKWDGGRK